MEGSCRRVSFSASTPPPTCRRACLRASPRRARYRSAPRVHQAFVPPVPPSGRRVKRKNRIPHHYEPPVLRADRRIGRNPVRRKRTRRKRIDLVAIGRLRGFRAAQPHHALEQPAVRKVLDARIAVRTPSRTASPVPSSTRKNWSSLWTSAPISSLGFNAITTSWQCFAV